MHRCETLWAVQHILVNHTSISEIINIFSLLLIWNKLWSEMLLACSLCGMQSADEICTKFETKVDFRLWAELSNAAWVRV